MAIAEGLISLGSWIAPIQVTNDNFDKAFIEISKGLG